MAPLPWPVLIEMMGIQRKNLPGVVLALLSTMAPANARAESPNEFTLGLVKYGNRGYGEPVVPTDAGLDRNSVGYETIRQATTTNAQIYGSIGAFERYLRPIIDEARGGEEERRDPADRRRRDESFSVFALDHHQTYNVGRAIGLCKQIPGAEGVPSTCDGRPRAYSADLYSTSISIGRGDRRTGYFLSASHSLSILPGPGGGETLAVQRGLFSAIIALQTVGGMPIYRLLGKKVLNYLMPGSADGIVGGYTTIGPIKMYGGYVLSTGVFGELAMPDYSPFLSATVTDTFSRLPLLKGGLRDLDPTSALGLPKYSGFTSLFAQRFELPTPALPSVRSEAQGLAQEQLADLKNTAVQVITTHLQQANIQKFLDVRLAAGLYPSAFLHEAVVTVHTPSFSRKAVAAAHSYQRVKGVQWSLSVGAVALPDLSYYGVRGGTRLLLNAQIQYGIVRAFIRMNESEFLQSFPFAYNAVNGGLIFAYGGT
jgi:hypothetical protein